MGLKVEIKGAESLEKSFSKMPKGVLSAAAVGVVKTNAEVQKQAVKVHRFKRKKGDLQRSVKQRAREKEFDVYLDDNEASHGKWIHGGFKSWRADQFLYKAFRNKVKRYEVNINKEIRKVLKRLF
jgi:hypothetical protein